MPGAHRALSRRACPFGGSPSPPCRCPSPTPHPAGGTRQHRAPPPRAELAVAADTHTSAACHTPHTVPELARAHRVAHFRRHTSFTSCGHAALTTSTHTHSPHTAHTLSAPGACRRGTAPHPARSERTTCAAPSLSRSCVWLHPQRLTLGSQRRLSSPLSSLRISRQPCENSPRRSMRQQTPRTRSPRRRPGRRTSWRWRGCARAGRAG